MSMRLAVPFVALTAFCFSLSIAMAEEQRWIRDAAISPDGQRIAFSYRGQIFTVDGNGGEANAITPARGHDQSPVWSAIQAALHSRPM